MLQLSYTYTSCIAGSERVNWRIDDILTADQPLLLDRAILPSEMTDASALRWLDAGAERTLNQITGHAYTNLFAVIEEYILAAMIDAARERVHIDHDAVRALLRVAEEEVKHQRLFERYRGAFRRGFGHECEVLGSASDVAARILQFHPLAVMLLTLHLELVTQQHYTQSVKSWDDLEPSFARVLKAHWVEEAQHARIDALELKRMLESSDDATIDSAFVQYFEMLRALSSIVAGQAEMDAASLQNATARTLRVAEREALIRAQRSTYERLFIHHGVTNPTFLKLMEMVSAERARAVREFRL